MAFEGVVYRTRCLAFWFVSCSGSADTFSAVEEEEEDEEENQEEQEDKEKEEEEKK